MPIYVYRCEDCEQEFERLEKLDAPTENECPSCQGKSRRIISSGHGRFQLKGEKWFKTSGEY
jgi:putative FmdB family regulatory protein